MSIEAPANSSRYFNSPEEAREQTSGRINYVLHSDGYLYNNQYDSSLVKYDDSYSTENQYQLEISVNAFEEISEKLSGRRMIEIGCGQLEFTDYLISKGFTTQGIDPVCGIRKSYLKRGFFDLDDISKSGAKLVFIMRCVLPHFEHPFNFLDKIFYKFPSALILMQHQRIDFFAQTHSWNSIMHDHVNQFGDDDFANRYNVLSSIFFAKGEWKQILIGKLSGNPTPWKSTSAESLAKLLESRKNGLSSLKKLDDIYIFGAAGKGINFAFSCARESLKINGAFDDQEKIWGKYLEGSGVPVLSTSGYSPMESTGNLIVMNPNHLEMASNRFSNTFNVYSLMTLEKI